jgi:hypothetical protein
MIKEELIERINELKSKYGSYHRDEFEKYMEDCDEIEELEELLEEKFS